jgi:hypothetical protein
MGHRISENAETLLSRCAGHQLQQLPPGIRQDFADVDRQLIAQSWNMVLP